MSPGKISKSEVMNLVAQVIGLRGRLREDQGSRVNVGVTKEK